jgi:hypothetical protein
VIDVVFDPKGALGIVGGTVRIMARTPGTEAEIASATITSPDQPLSLSGACGCDEYVVKASLGSDPGAAARATESSGREGRDPWSVLLKLTPRRARVRLTACPLGSAPSSNFSPK